MKQTLKNIWNRFYKNPLSSTLGIILLIVFLIGMFLEKVSVEQFILFFPTILGLLYVKDSIFKP